MANIRIVTDSTSDIPAAVSAELGIRVVPLNVHFGDDTLKDQAGISSAAFYDRLKSDPNHPKTSQPSPEEFMTVYRELLEEDCDIVSMHISGKLSGTVQSAQLAQKEIGSGRITVIDTGQACIPQGMLVTRAARMAAEGKHADDIKALVEYAFVNMQTYFVVDTLECLQKGGRIGKAASLIGGILHIKPILVLKDGHVQAFEKLRGSSRVYKRLGEIFAGFLTEQKAGRIMLGFAHAQDEAALMKLKDQIGTLYNPEKADVCEIGAVIGAHVGPGALAVSFCPEF